MSSSVYGAVIDAANANGSGDLEGGVYNLEFLKIEDGTTKDRKTKVVTVSVRVADGPDKGRRAFIKHYESENGISFSQLRSNLNALGVSDAVMKESSSAELTEILRGSVAEWEVSVKAKTRGTGNWVTYRVLSTEVEGTDESDDEGEGGSNFSFGS